MAVPLCCSNKLLVSSPAEVVEALLLVGNVAIVICWSLILPLALQADMYDCWRITSSDFMPLDIGVSALIACFEFYVAKLTSL
jgi:hypothetical protein